MINNLIQMMFIISFLFIFKIVFAQECDSTNNYNCFPSNIKYKRMQYGNQTINRPIFHFTPPQGWMNDPNGLFYDGHNYHIYYQHNPANNIWELPLYWGHAVFDEGFATWTHKPIAIQPTDKISGAYSGSIYIDDENKSTLFGNVTDSNQRIIAMWTMTYYDWVEYQVLSYSLDGGTTFITPATVGSETVNPAVTYPGTNISEISSQFRDPQVIKYSRSPIYIMSVAKSHEYAINFYLSTNALKFTYAGKFEMAGYLGFQYECPNLVRLENTDIKTGEAADYWVLFISINPGSQQGGSSTEYFIGQLNVDTTGETGTVSFTYINNGYTTLLDLGKDFYAMQLFYEPPSNTDENSDVYAARNYATGIAWASNWQYTALVPTDPWRSSTSLPRHIKIAHYSIAAKELLYIFSKPCIDLSKVNTTEWKTAVKTNDLQYDLDLSERAYGALEFEFEFTVADSFTNDDPGVITLYLYGLSVPEEYLRVGFNQKADAFFIDRGHTNVQFVHNNPFFTDKLSVNVYGTSAGSTTIKKKRTQVNNDTNLLDYDTSDDFKEQGISKFKVHGIVDRNIIELFFNEVKDNEGDDFGWSALSSTNTFFFTGGNFIGTLKVEFNSPTKVLGETTENVGFDNISLRGRQLNPLDE